MICHMETLVSNPGRYFDLCHYPREPSHVRGNRSLNNIYTLFKFN